VSKLGTKKRRSRARRRASVSIISREVQLAADEAGETPEVVTLVEGPLAVVLEVRTGDDVSIYIGGAGAPWGRRGEVRC
jgi:hypothetical protein